MKNLPARWFIRRDRNNYRELNPLLQKVNGREYTGRGYALYKIDGERIVQESDVFCYPVYKKQTYIYRDVPHSMYTEITLEQLKNSFKMSTILKKLPESWHIVVTNENMVKVRKWRFGETGKTQLPLHSIVGMYAWGKKYGYNIGKEWSDTYDSGFGQEITSEDFRFHVLKEYNLSDFREGRVVIERPIVSDTLLNSYVKSLNSSNFNILSSNSNEKYITFLRNSTLWTSIEKTNLPIIKDIKELYKNEKMNKKEDFQGYLVKSTLNTVAKTLFQKEFPYEHDSWNNNVQLDGYNFQKNTSAAHYFERLGVLQLWFDKVIEKPLILPMLGGCQGKLEGDYLKYGCQKVHKSLFDPSICKLDYMKVSGTKVTRSEIKQIQKYVAKFG